MTLRMRASLASLLSLATITPALAAQVVETVKPQHLTVDRSLSQADADAAIKAALRYDTFWATGREELARSALSPHFIDNTLPPGRPQGVDGPIAASKAFRGAVPDLDCDVEQLVVSGDRVVALLHFKGHFTGVFQGHKGKGQIVDFIATDFYRIQDGQIAEDWHLEDNLTFLKQIGAVAP